MTAGQADRSTSPTAALVAARTTSRLTGGQQRTSVVNGDTTHAVSTVGPLANCPGVEHVIAGTEGGEIGRRASGAGGDGAVRVFAAPGIREVDRFVAGREARPKCGAQTKYHKEPENCFHGISLQRFGSTSKSVLPARLNIVNLSSPADKVNI